VSDPVCDLTQFISLNTCIYHSLQFMVRNTTEILFLVVQTSLVSNHVCKMRCMEDSWNLLNNTTDSATAAYHWLQILQIAA